MRCCCYIYPIISYKTKILCNGIQILELTTTKPELKVDIWSGNHPFYTNSQVIVDSEVRVEKFMKKYRLDTAD